MSKKKTVGQTLHRAPTVVPAHRFVGVVLTDGQEAPVTCLACLGTGEVVVLVLSGPRATVAATAALFFLKKTRTFVSFLPAAGEHWHGPTRLLPMQKLGSSRIVSSVGLTSHQNVAILANAANIAHCQLNPVPFPDNDRVSAPPSGDDAASSAHPPRLQLHEIPPPRFVLGSEGSDHPDWLTFIGMMRSLWLPFPLELAPAIWQAGVQERFRPSQDELSNSDEEQMLIAPVEQCLGIQGWGILPTRQWEAVIQRETRRMYALRQPSYQGGEIVYSDQPMPA